MFDRFTIEAIGIINMTQEEAQQLGHTRKIGTEFILLGLIREDQAIAGKILRRMGMTLEDTRHEVEEKIGRGLGDSAVEIPFSKNAKTVLERAFHKAMEREHSLVLPEHLLLAIVSLKKCTACQILETMQIDVKRNGSDHGFAFSKTIANDSTTPLS